MSAQKLNQKTIAVIGLGYVGLPLAVEFGKQRDVIGFDINEARVAALRAGRDQTLECSAAELQEAVHLRYSHQLEDLAEARSSSSQYRPLSIRLTAPI